MQQIFHRLCRMAAHVYLQKINSQAQDYFTIANKYGFIYLLWQLLAKFNMKENIDTSWQKFNRSSITYLFSSYQKHWVSVNSWIKKGNENQYFIISLRMILQCKHLGITTILAYHKYLFQQPKSRSVVYLWQGIQFNEIIPFGIILLYY